MGLSVPFTLFLFIFATGTGPSIQVDLRFNTPLFDSSFSLGRAGQGQDHGRDRVIEPRALSSPSGSPWNEPPSHDHQTLDVVDREPFGPDSRNPNNGANPERFNEARRPEVQGTQPHHFETRREWERPTQSQGSTPTRQYPPRQPPYLEPWVNHQPYLTPPSLKFKVGIVSDFKDSRGNSEGKYKAQLREGSLVIQRGGEKLDEHNITLKFDDENVHEFHTGYNRAGSGLELATLNVFNGGLYACDDQTGIVYQIVERNKTWSPRPWVILINRGSKHEGFHCEWATVRDNALWVGSKGSLIGKANENGDVENEPIGFDRSQQVVKKIYPDGYIENLDWSNNYDRLASQLDIDLEIGYIDYNAAAWSEKHRKWIFLPKRVSHDGNRDTEKSGKKSSNAGFLVSEDFTDVKVKTFGRFEEVSGVTDVKFIPGTDLVLVLRVKKVSGSGGNGTYSSHIGVYDMNGHEISPEVKVADGIFAGVEFL